MRPSTNELVEMWNSMSRLSLPKNERLIMASYSYHRNHPAVSAVAAYKHLNAALSRGASNPEGSIMKRWTLSQIRAANKAAGGHFFDAKTMKFFGDTMKNFRVVHSGDEVLVQRFKTSAKGAPPKTWRFDPHTGGIRQDGSKVVRVGGKIIENPAHQGWSVFLNGSKIDTVFYTPDSDADYVRRSLIDHDGYDSRITVRKDNKYRSTKKNPLYPNGKKVYNLKYNIGKSKYVVNFHDGAKTHRDGSAFYDIKIFKNKLKRDAFVHSLRSQGYSEESYSLGSNPRKYGKTYRPSAPLGSGLRFKTLAKQLGARKGKKVKCAPCLAAAIGRKKYGKKFFQTLAARGRRLAKYRKVPVSRRRVANN